MKDRFKMGRTWECCVFLFTLFVAVSAQAEHTEKHVGSHTVRWEKVQSSSLDSAVSYPGRITACRQARLAFRVSGPLIQVNVSPGDRVKKGQVLMQIDPQDFRDQIAVLEAQLEGARSRLQTARLDLQRGQTLFDQKVIPQADFDHILNGQQIAAAQVAQVQAQLNIARHQLAYSSLKAPYDGIIIDTTVENHEMVSAGRPVVLLHDISVLEIIAGVPENELIRHPLQPNSAGFVRFPALGDQQFSASLKEWKTAADPATKTFEVTFSLKKPENQQIFPGMTAELFWSSGDESGTVLTVPTKAVFMGPNGKSMVWIYNSDTRKASGRQIETNGFAGDGRSIVSSGLTGNEKIVTGGMDFITEDMDLSSLVRQEDRQ